MVLGYMRKLRAFKVEDWARFVIYIRGNDNVGVRLEIIFFF